MASLALGVAGAAVGFYLGGPTGASIGWSLGSAAGGALFAKGQEGPRLSDLRLQNSSYGAPIPIGYGTIRAAGVVIWSTDLVEHKEKHGGKGGPSSTSYNYTASFAVGLCEGPIVGIRRIWADGRLIYGEETPSDEVPMTIYLGTETQDPDPTIESIEGVGNVPGHRGMAYVVFTDWDLSAFYNRIPNLSFEIQCSGTLDLRFERDWFVDWDIGETGWNLYAHPQTLSGTIDNPDGTITLHRYRKGNAYGDWPTPSGPNDDTKVYYDQRTYDRDGNLLEEQARVTLDFAPLTSPVGLWSSSNSGIAYVTWTHYENPDYIADFMWLKNGVPTFTTTEAHGINRQLGITGPPLLHRGWIYAEDNSGADLILRRWPAPDGGVYTELFDPTVSFNADAQRTDYPAGGAWAASTGNGLTVSDDGNIFWGVNYSGGADGFRLFKLDPELSLLNTWWTLSAEAPTLPLSTYSFTVWHGMWLGYGSGYIVGFPSFQLHTLNADGSTTFIDELVVPTVNGEAVSSEVISLGGGYAAWVGGILAIGAPGIPLSEIVADVSDRCGYSATQYDVTALTDIVKGYTITSRMSGRAAIDALRPVYQFGAVESNQTVKFRKWTGLIDATVPDSDLGARPAGSEPVDPLGTTRAQEADLPRQVDAIFIDYGFDYQEGHQLRQRETTSSELEVSIAMPVVLTADEALQAAEVILFNAWMEREKFRIQLPRKWAHLEPTDVISVAGRSMRIVGKDEQGYTHIVFDALATGVNVFVSAPVGVPPVSFVPPTVPVPNVTELRLLDLPLITDSDYANGFYASVAGAASSSWPGATIFQSRDGGVNYNSVTDTTIPYAMGRASTVLGDWSGGNVFDEINSVTVVLIRGSPELTSSNELGVLNGANMATLDGEVFQFKTATLTAELTYQLSGLLRGRRGTEWVLHAVNGLFEMLPDINIKGPFAELGQERLYKAVTTGQTLASATVVTFTNTGIALKEYAPTTLGGGRNGSGDLLLTWVPRARTHGNWQDYVDVPAEFLPVDFKLAIYSDGTYTTILAEPEVLGDAFYLYSAADQTTDFGSLQATVYWSVSARGLIGYGYEALGAT